MHLIFPITIATCPFRIPNSNKQPVIDYNVCCDHVEGGMYIGPEFRTGGQVYDGSLDVEDVVLYRFALCANGPLFNLFFSGPSTCV